MNLIRYYNQNRKKIWGILIIIASVFVVLYLIDIIANNIREDAQVPINTISQADINNNTDSSVLTTNQSVVTGENVEGEQLKDATTIIDEFISFCNKKDLQSAYDLLTDECKQQMYTSLDVFEQAYYNDIFNGGSRICSIENWVGNTYKVRIMEDILTTGKSNNGYSKQDYITVEEIEDGYKLNINNYIGYTQIDRQTEDNNIIMNVIGKNTYMDYEEYTIKVTNNNENTIVLDGRNDVKSLYLEDSNEAKSSAYTHELTDPMLRVEAGQTKEITIKFYSQYVSTKKIEYVVFSDLILYDSQSGEKIEFKAKV